MNSATQTDSEDSLKIGAVIDDKWIILGFIGKGAMGEVYRARQLNLQRDVAVKVISRRWLQSFDEGDPEIDTSLQRFRREVQAMARIRHPSVLPVYDHGTMPPPQDSDETPQVFLPEAETPFFNEMDAIIRKATAESKEDRFESVAELRGSLKDALMISVPEDAEAPAVKPSTRFWYSPKWISTGVAIAVLSIAAMSAWHLIGNPGWKAAERSDTAALRDESPAVEPLGARTQRGRTNFPDNGAVLRSIPGGIVALPLPGKGKTVSHVSLAPFQIETGSQSVTALRQNKYDVRLMPPGFGAWAQLPDGKTSAGGPPDADFVSMPQSVERKPWEAFDQVGFRCARSSPGAPAARKQPAETSAAMNSPTNKGRPLQ